MISRLELDCPIACYGIGDLGCGVGDLDSGVSMWLVSFWLGRFGRVKIADESDKDIGIGRDSPQKQSSW